MTYPKKHQNELKAYAQAYQGFSEIFNNPSLTKIINDLYKNPDSRKKAAANCKKYLSENGIKLPKGFNAEFVENKWHIGISGEFGPCKFKAGYNSEGGWYAEGSCKGKL